MTLEEKLQETVRKLNKRKFKVKATVGEAPQYVAACINLENWEVNVTIDKNIESSLTKIPNGLIPSKSPLGDLLAAVSLHEFGHNTNPEGFFGCPGDEEYFKKTVEGISDALKELKLPEEEIQPLIPQIANLFEDYIVNSSYALKDRERASFMGGMTAFYYLNSMQKAGQGFTTLYGHFVDLQMKTFWRQEKIRDFAQSITPNYSQKLIRGMFKVFSDNGELTDKLMKNDLDRDDELKYYEELNDKDKWNLKAYEFTKLVYPLMKQDKQQNQEQNQQPSQSDQSGSCESSGGSGPSYNQNQGKKGKSEKSGEGESQGSKPKSDDKGEDGEDNDDKGPEKQQGKEGKSGEGQGGMPSDSYYTQKYKNDAEFRKRIDKEANPMYKKPQKPQKGEGQGESIGKPKQAFGSGEPDEDESDKQATSSARPFRQGGKADRPPRLEGGFLSIDPSYIPRLYQFYESLAGKMTVVPPQEGPDETQRLPIGYMQKKRIDHLGQTPLDEIDWESTMHMPNDDWSFFAKQCPITVQEEGQPAGGSTKDICFIGDVSGSMHYSAPFMIEIGQNLNMEGGGGMPLDMIKKLNIQLVLGGYDNFLVMVHSVIKELKEKQMGYHLKYSSILFSESTEFSGWRSYYELDGLLAWMYTHYQGGGTNFDANVLKDTCNRASDKFLTIMLSDGQISNANETARIVGGIIKAGNEFLLIEYQNRFEQIRPRLQGQFTAFGQYVKQLGGEVHEISDINDLFKITLGKAKEMY